MSDPTSCSKTDPSPDPGGYRVFRDGSHWCAVGPGFVNLQASMAAFGVTPVMALIYLLDAEQKKATQDPVPVSPPAPVGSDLAADLVALLNRHSAENGSDTPDFVLAGLLLDVLLLDVLRVFHQAIQLREKWYGRERAATGGDGPVPAETEP